MSKRTKPGDQEQQPLDLRIDTKPPGPVECLGLTFESDEARRAHFTEALREKLRDPDFRKTPGFPKAGDEDILKMSDPPYYTACPNPFIEGFVAGRSTDESAEYECEPFAVDVSEGRYAPESLAHSYHTKVPARAIARYILHYTSPGDTVLDAFCGTGMTGLAAQLCDGVDQEFRAKLDEEMTNPVWGPRRAVLSDLSPAATLIAKNYCKPVDAMAFRAAAKKLIADLQDRWGWMYETDHVAKGGQAQTGRINYTIWSDVVSCPECGAEFPFWDVAVDVENKDIAKTFPCPECKADLTKAACDRVTSTDFDPELGKATKRLKQAPVRINYTVGKKRYDKRPDAADLARLAKVEGERSDLVPLFEMLFRSPPWGDMYRAGYHEGVSHFHHFYTRRNLLTLSSLAEAVRGRHDLPLSMLLTATGLKLSRMSRFQFDAVGRIQNGVLYLPSLFQEMSPFLLLPVAVEYIGRFHNAVRMEAETTIVSTGSATGLKTVPDCTVDYVFTDPPFGGNIMYSELNFIWESWFRVHTNNQQEAIVNKTQGKAFDEYQTLMEGCFAEYFRVLKPGRWMTVEFHNSQNSVWIAIQEAISRAGFVIADVRTLDKKQKTFKQATTAGAVKQDLIITAYRPSKEFESAFGLAAGTEEGAWHFVRSHLEKLPVFSGDGGVAATVAERLDYVLFDRMVAFHVQHGISLPLSAAEFYMGLKQRFPERDGMFFLSDQVARYDKQRSKVSEIRQLDLFVTDEASAIQWLRQQLGKKPQTFQELHPQFMRELQSWAKHERTVELREMLEQNFLHYDGKGPVPSQIHAYLSTNFKDLRNRDKEDSDLRDKAKDRWYVPDPGKQVDLEKLRDRTLLREFEDYKTSTQRRLKQFRTEALRAGFKVAYDAQDYRCIVDVAKKIPENVLQEDEKLLMYYDVASMRLGEE